jgi:hypothetical protein
VEVPMNFTTAIACLAAGVLIVMCWLLLTRAQPKPDTFVAKGTATESSNQRTSDQDPDRALPFGYKCAWFAVRSHDNKIVANALGVQNARIVTWHEGVAAAYSDSDRDVFLTPPIRGWVLVAGRHLASESTVSGKPRWMNIMIRLAERFPDVQFYATHRVVEYHLWVQAKDSRIIRHYEFIGDQGETVANEGELTTDERDLGLIFDADRSPVESDVMMLAGKWSVNPVELGESDEGRGMGLVGDLKVN